MERLFTLVFSFNYRSMRKLLFSLTLFSTAFVAQAQSQRPSVHLEFAGPSTFLGLHYDARVSSTSPWGYRIGLGYISGSDEETSYNPGIYKDAHHLSLPIGLYRLHGKKRHYLEWGLGTNVGYTWNEHPQAPLQWRYVKNGIYGFLYASLGYRYQPIKGVSVRAGFTAWGELGNVFGVHEDGKITPYLSIGYAF